MPVIWQSNLEEVPGGPEPIGEPAEAVSESASQSVAEETPITATTTMPTTPATTDAGVLFDADCDLTQCNTECTWIFDRLRVRPTITQGTWIEWQVHPGFTGKLPYTFQLQVGHTANNLADDWANVGLSAENVSYMTDDTQRVYGKTQWTHYRVLLTDADGNTYTSEPQHCWGDLPRRYWRLVNNRERMWLKQFKATIRGQQGYLLKRRLTGAQPEPGEGTIDYVTFELVNPQDPDTVGTEYDEGYYDPIPCVYADLERVTRREHLDEGKARGTINDGLKVPATMLAVPMVDSYDVWVDKDSDFRWEIHNIQHLEEIEGVPVVVKCEFRLLPFTHPIYDFVIDDQVLVS